MQEFSSVTVPAGEATSLTELLNARSAEGWTVVSIVPAAQSIVAYLSRPSGSTSTATAAAVTSSASLTPEPASASATPSPSPSVSPSPTAATPTTPVVDASPAPAVPSGWYADPSGRFEIRYWDGESWTEHVSRGGQQSTDPPVA
jgi:hypothetical protein